jgi:hypothetical protein
LGREPEADELADLAAYERELRAELSAAPPSTRVEPRIPARVSGEFLEGLEPDQILPPPGAPWRSLSGVWATPYNNTLEVSADNGPAVVIDALDAMRFQLNARLRLLPGTRRVVFLLGVRSPEGAESGPGPRLVLDVERGRVAFRARAEPSAEDVETPLELTAGAPLELRAGRGRSEWKFELRTNDAVTQLSAPDCPPAGRALGISVLGQGVELESFALGKPEDARELLPPPPLDPATAALANVCLVLFSSNEFVYVD